MNTKELGGSAQGMAIEMCHGYIHTITETYQGYILYHYRNVPWLHSIPLWKCIMATFHTIIEIGRVTFRTTIKMCHGYIPCQYRNAPWLHSILLQKCATATFHTTTEMYHGYIPYHMAWLHSIPLQKRPRL